jgi:hypothetical protein
VPVGTDHAGDDVTDRHAVAHLRNRAYVVMFKDLERRILKPGLLRTKVCDLGGHRLGFAGDIFLPRCIAIEAPRGLATTFSDAGIRIDTGGLAQFSSSLLMWVGTHDYLLSDLSILDFVKN